MTTEGISVHGSFEVGQSLSSPTIVGGFISANVVTPTAASPAYVIFDTDIGTDCDDVGALAILAAAHRSGTVVLKAVIVVSSSIYAAGSAFQTLRYCLGPNTIPLAFYNGGVARISGASAYAATLSQGTWGNFPAASPTSYPGHIPVARQAMADLVKIGAKAVYVAIGTMTALAEILVSPPDAISPLTGAALFSAAISRISMMAANDPGDPTASAEYNVATDVPGALAVQTALAGLIPPVPRYWVSFQLGNAIPAVPPVNSSSPISVAYTTFTLGAGNTRPAWDSLAAAFALWGDRNILVAALSGVTNTIAANGTNVWSTTPGVDISLSLNPALPTSWASTTLSAMMGAASPPAILATGATLVGFPTTATSGTALNLSGASVTLSPAGATGYAALVSGGVEVGSRTAFYGSVPPAKTPNAGGAAYYEIFAAATGGTALAISPAITVAATALALDGLATTPIMAVSTKLIRTAYAGSCIQVRRSSDSTTQDIGFAAGALDETALATFVGSGDGVVTRWYRQDATAAGAYLSPIGSPKIMTAGVIQRIKSGGSAAIRQISGANTGFSTALGINTTTALAVVAADNQSSTQSSARLVSYTATGDTNDYATAASFGVYVSNGTTIGIVRNGSVAPFTSAITAGPNLVSCVLGATSTTLALNGTNYGPNTTTAGTIGPNGTFYIGTDVGGDYFAGAFAEVILTTDITAQATIEASQKTRFGTP